MNCSELVGGQNLLLLLQFLTIARFLRSRFGAGINLYRETNKIHFAIGNYLHACIEKTGFGPRPVFKNFWTTFCRTFFGILCNFL